MFVPNAHEHIGPVPEDCPAILFIDIGGVNLAFVVELVNADVHAVRVQAGPFATCSEWLTKAAG
jgi:hypothetical protein